MIKLYIAHKPFKPFKQSMHLLLQKFTFPSISNPAMKEEKKTRPALKSSQLSRRAQAPQRHTALCLSSTDRNSARFLGMHTYAGPIAACFRFN